MTDALPKAAMVLLAALLVAGCSSSARAVDRVSVIEVEIPLKEPEWADGQEAVLATAGDGSRIARISSEGGVDYRTFDEEIGDTVTPNPEDPRFAYLPLPGSERIAVLSAATLETLRSFDLKNPPLQTSLDVQSGVLFAISEDGATVSGVDLEKEGGTFPTTEIGGVELLEAPEKGLYPAFWVGGPDGVAFYAGERPEKLVESPISAKDIAADRESAQRVFVVEGGPSGRVVALEGDPQRYLEGDLVVAAERSLDGPVEYLASDSLYVFAAMRGELVVMRRETLEVIETVEFSEARKSLAGAAPSGVTVGAERAYVTLEDEPYVISVEKP